MSYQLSSSASIWGFGFHSVDQLNYRLVASLTRVQWFGGHNVLQMVRDRNGAVVPIMKMSATAARRRFHCTAASPHFIVLQPKPSLPPPLFRRL
jgi:hypothetical protein